MLTLDIIQTDLVRDTLYFVPHSNFAPQLPGETLSTLCQKRKESLAFIHLNLLYPLPRRRKRNVRERGTQSPHSKPIDARNETHVISVPSVRKSI
jgi:hypothetical protein